MTSTPGALKRFTRIMRPGKESEKTPKAVNLPFCVKYRKAPPEKTPIPSLTVALPFTTHHAAWVLLKGIKST
jgi:hypothetical protein